LDAAVAGVVTAGSAQAAVVPQATTAHTEMATAIRF